MKETPGEWLRVTKGRPCKICGKPDYCTYTSNGKYAKCMRAKSEKESEKGGWIHPGDGSLVDCEFLAKKNKTKVDVDWDERGRSMARCRDSVAMRESVAEELCVTVSSLEQLFVGYGYDDYRGVDFSSWPERNSNGRIVGITRRFKTGDKMSMRWSSHGLFFADNWNLMPGTVFVPEGGSDTAALISIGLNAVGRPSATGGMNHLPGLLKGTERKICVLAENDEAPERRGEIQACPPHCVCCPYCWPGLDGAMGIAKKLSGKLHKRIYCTLIPGHKDVRSWRTANPEASAVDFVEFMREHWINEQRKEKERRAKG